MYIYIYITEPRFTRIGFGLKRKACLAAAVPSQFLDVGTLAADQQPGPRNWRLVMVQHGE